jgi:hypothetical protein
MSIFVFKTINGGITIIKLTHVVVKNSTIKLTQNVTVCKKKQENDHS